MMEGFNAYDLYIHGQISAQELAAAERQRSLQRKQGRGEVATGAQIVEAMLMMDADKAGKIATNRQKKDGNGRVVST